MASTNDEKNVPEKTVAMSPEDLGATVPAEPVAPTSPAAEPAPTAHDAARDPDATRRADAAPTRAMVPDNLPTIVIPSERPATEAIPADGIDAMGDPYYAPVSPQDLTSAKAPVSIPSPVQSLPERKRRLPVWAIVLVVVVLLAAAGGAAWYTYDQEVWGGKTVPTVVGLSVEDATRALEGLGFGVEVEEVSADDGIGTVLSSDPAEGERVDPAAGITLEVAAQRTIPQVVGSPVDEAQAALSAAGATNVSLTYQNSEQPSGTVLAVDPDEGEAFVSTDQITLTVARAFTVPDVRGMALEDAQTTLEAGGLTSSVAYVRSDAERGTVVETSPGFGSEVAAGSSVELSVATPLPGAPHDLLAYFDAVPEALSDYLADEGFSLDYGEVYASGGNAHAAYTGAEGDLLQITNEPETAHYAGESTADVLATGAAVGGVRYSFSTSTLPAGGALETEDGVRAVMAACGLDGLLDTCTAEDVTLPEGAPDDAGAHHFICGYGTQGDYTWAVIIGGYEGSTSVTALVAPTAHFSEVDLTPYGGSVCDYIAYIDQYTG